MKNGKYDIFISYRRNGGDQTAKAIYDELSTRGYKVFYDIETLRSGSFNTELYKKVKMCKDFILVLPPNGLDRCNEDDDWVRLEIVYALKYNKNIIPIMLRGFEFPKTMPNEIEPIRMFNGLIADVTYFDAVVNRLCSKFLESKVGFRNKYKAKRSFPKILFSIFAIIFIIVLFIGITYIYKAVDSIEKLNNISKMQNSTEQSSANVESSTFKTDSNNMNENNVNSNNESSINTEEYFPFPNIEKGQTITVFVGSSLDGGLEVNHNGVFYDFSQIVVNERQYKIEYVYPIIHGMALMTTDGGDVIGLDNSSKMVFISSYSKEVQLEGRQAATGTADEFANALEGLIEPSVSITDMYYNNKSFVEGVYLKEIFNIDEAMANAISNQLRESYNSN